MDLKELTNLISVRDYVVLAVENPRMSKRASTELMNILIMLEKKIFTCLTSDKFKNYIDYKDVQKNLEEIIRTSNIKSKK